MNKVEVKGFVKYYGDFCAVNNVSFSFQSGKLTALCGRNGSGKSTSIRCMLGLLKADEGDVIVNGSKKKLDYKKVGYLAEERGMFVKEDIGFQLEFFAKMKGMSKKSASKAVEYWLERFELSEYKNKKLESLSKGNQQKIQMIAALVHDPEIIIFDEPFSGLDPVNMQFILELLQSLKEQGKCILVSSHQLALIEGICEDICIINKSENIYTGSIIDLKRQYGADYLYFTTKSNVKLARAENYAPQSYRIPLHNYEEFKHEMRLLLDSSIELESVERKTLNLQEIFVELVRDKNENELGE